MIRVFYGDDRVRAGEEIKKYLGDDYEVIEGADLVLQDLPSVFLGNSLFSEKRRILIRDLTVNKNVSEEIEKYLDTPHEVVIFEQKVAKSSSFYKKLNKRVEFREFKLPETSFYLEVASIYNMAKRDGKRAVAMLEKIRFDEEPLGFAGMMNTIALKEFDRKPGSKEKRVLIELSELDMQLKTTTFSPWTLISAFLLRLASSH